MKFTDIKKWVDAQANIKKAEKDCSCFCKQISTCHTDSVQLYKGIEIVAEVLCIDLDEEVFDLDEEVFNDGHIKLSFMYDGIEFIQIGRSEDE